MQQQEMTDKRNQPLKFAHFDVTDKRNRPLKDLRISVTDRCNFRCTYCMPADIFGPAYPFLPPSHILTFAELIRLARIFAGLGVDKIRITGGEPLLRPNLAELIAGIREVPGIADIAMTTNGSLLAQQAAALRDAGLKRVTVSLDSLDEERFGAINGRGFKAATVLAGIDRALEAGLSVKINMVVQRGVNDQDVLPMARYFKAKGLTLRFIEFMDVGNTNGWRLDSVVPSAEIMRLIDREMPLVPLDKVRYGEVAERYAYADGAAEVGFISSVTRAFCATCTRARLSADGKLYTCLFASDGDDLQPLLRGGATDGEIAAKLRAVWSSREDRYSEIRSSYTDPIEKVEMSHIGG